MDRIVGQDGALGVLRSQLESGRLHHAYIFHGPPGVGKFTTALGFARTLLCHDRRSAAAACGACASCRLIDSARETPDAAIAGPHPDLGVLTKELARYSNDRAIRERKLTQIPVVVLRSGLIEPVYRAARMRRGKVFIVDEAELLNPTGQNLLLKTLEEPPAGTTIILVTASIDRLLPTVRSRCQRVGFVPIDDDHIRSWLESNGPQPAKQQVEWLIAFAGGSIGRARLAREYDLTRWAAEVLPVMDDMSEGGGDGGLGSTMADLVGDFAEAWVREHDGASKEAANRLAADLMWSMIATRARQRLAARAGGCDPDDPAGAEAVLEPWLGVVHAIDEAQRLVGSNVNLGLVCDHLVVVMNRCFVSCGDPSLCPGPSFTSSFSGRSAS